MLSKTGWLVYKQENLLKEKGDFLFLFLEEV